MASHRPRPDRVEVAVDVDLQQRGRVTPGTPRLCRLRTLESETYQMKLVNDDIDGTHPIVFIDSIIQTLRKRHALPSAQPFDVPAHRHLRSPDE